MFFELEIMCGRVFAEADDAPQPCSSVAPFHLHYCSINYITFFCFIYTPAVEAEKRQCNIGITSLFMKQPPLEPASTFHKVLQSLNYYSRWLCGCVPNPNKTLHAGESLGDVRAQN